MFLVKLISGLGAIAVIWLLGTVFVAGGMFGFFTNSFGSGGIPFREPTAFINLDHPATYTLYGGRYYQLTYPVGYTITISFVNGGVTLFGAKRKNKSTSGDCKRGTTTYYRSPGDEGELVVVSCAETTELKVLSVEPGKQF